MFRYLALPLAFAAALSLEPQDAAAAVMRIDCPLAEAQVEMVSRLPSGWWQTPQVGRLQTTKLANIGGATTLMCGYSAYGTEVFAMMEAPAGMDCRGDATGFSCSSPGVVATRTHSTGSINLRQTYVMDLDNGTEGGRDGGDIWFQAQSAALRLLTPMNGASMAIAGLGSIDLEGCQRLGGYVSVPLPVELFPVGIYVCVKTNEGRYAQFRVNGGPGGSPGMLAVGYTTWAN